MDFIDRIRNLASRVPTQLDYCQTEEATKNALIMPFINALGYDVFDPTEVVPEFTADIGTKKGEKVDYAIMKDSKPIILFECKWSGADLNKEHASQLHRYFTAVPEVRFGVLTNGILYRFYSDLDAPNRMDDKPFFEFNMLDVRERTVVELKKFTKSTFDLDEIMTTASELKYTDAIRKIIAQEFETPSEGFMRFFASQVYSGRMTQPVREQFTEITRQALRRFLNDQINERLQSAIQGPDQPPISASPLAEESESELEEEDVSDPSREIVTTKDEIEGFFAVKSILRDVIDIKRVHMRDTKSYCGILLDDNNRKPICRLHFNRTQWYLGVLGEDKQEQRMAIDGIDNIYDYAEQIIATVNRYDAG
ncbi:MAG: type I restriction enzyme HsdR N-terminal domain-containing protein [Ardenticatenaceae bacterium]|nr:type I restriction enzyme HsdR N-terminal domain-containing protein [Ardenticatenaceae bacterium]